MLDRDETMKGRVCLVTGATSGIGEVTARAGAARGGRDRRRAVSRTLCRDARGSDTPGRSPSIRSSPTPAQADVRRLAGQIRDRCPRLDVLGQQRRWNVADPPRDRRGDRDDPGPQPPVLFPPLTNLLASRVRPRHPPGLSMSPRMLTREGRSISTISSFDAATAAGRHTSSPNSRTSCSPISRHGD